MDTYEKAYKEALERAKKLKENPKAIFFEEKNIHISDYIFPELKKSEDEKIRKALLEIVHDTTGDSLWVDYNVHKEDALAWLEKQGKQKETLCDKCKKAQPSHSCQDITALGRCYIENINTSINKVEPKFKVGDWIVSNEKLYVYQIEEINDFVAKVNENGVSFVVDVKCLNDAHLWTVEDAKDGDVLVNGSNIFIFHFINDTRLMGYCHVNTDDGRFYDDIGKNECFCLIDAVVNPATKEQRDLLFQKMREAGYEWDAEKKELKKIRNKIEIPFGAKDSELQEVTYYIPKGFYAKIEDDKVVIKKGEKPTALSEEDEVMLDEIIDFFENGTVKLQHDLSLYASWLASLKERCTWKPSDEQMDTLLSEVTAWTKGCPKQKVLESLYNDLKKLMEK